MVTGKWEITTTSYKYIGLWAQGNIIDSWKKIHLYPIPAGYGFKNVSASNLDIVGCIRINLQ